MAQGKNIQKLLSIDNAIKITTNPNQAVERIDGNKKIRLFNDDGTFLSRKNSVNNATGEIKGVWYFVGGDNYQIKYAVDGVVYVFDFKTDSTTQVKNQTQNVHPLLKKLLSLEPNAKITKSPNQLVLDRDDDEDSSRKRWVFFSNGTWKEFYGDVKGEPQDTGIWYFVGNNNYQIKNNNVLAGPKREVFDKKTNKWHAVLQTVDTPKRQIYLLTQIDEKIKKVSLEQAYKELGSGNDKAYLVFWGDGDVRYREGTWKNKEGQVKGTWKITFGDEKNTYMVTLEDGDTYSPTSGWSGIPENSTTAGSTAGSTTNVGWREVTFTLEDVLAGKAVLKRGMKGKAVEDLQKLMIQMNFSKVSKSGEPDGKYGKLTELSIRQFQGEMPYGEQDGKVGQRTLKRMYRVYNYDPDLEVDDEQPETPTGGENPNDGTLKTTQAPAPQTTQAQEPEEKLVLTPKNLQENIKKIVYENLKSLLK
jgi:peptidoglycan hydrolase-like protein with peptidoglycan-binding domain